MLLSHYKQVIHRNLYSSHSCHHRSLLKNRFNKSVYYLAKHISIEVVRFPVMKRCPLTFFKGVLAVSALYQ